MATFDIIQRVTTKGRIIPMLRRFDTEGSLGMLIYTGPECVSLEQAVMLGLAEFEKAPKTESKDLPAGKVEDPKYNFNESKGRGLPERKDDLWKTTNE